MKIFGRVASYYGLNCRACEEDKAAYLRWKSKVKS